jgi:hypothetical protein
MVKLGLTQRSPYPTIARVFQEFDALLLRERQASIKESLDKHFKEHTLPVLRKKVSRQFIYEEFGFTSENIKRWPWLRELLEGYDKQIAKLGYLSLERTDLLNRLKNLLSNDCPLTKGHNTLAMHKIVSILRTREAVLREEPFVGLINAKKRELRQGIGIPIGDVMVGGKVATFSLLTPAYSPEFILKLGSSYVTATSGYSEVAGIASSVKGFLCWLSTSKTENAAYCYDMINMGRLPGSWHWAQTLLEFQSESIASTTRKPISTRAMFTRLNPLLAQLGDDGVLPELERALEVPHADARRPTDRIKSLAEVSHFQEATRNKRKAQISESLKAGAKQHEIPFEELEIESFVACIEEELSIRKDALPADITTAVEAVLKKRLALIKARAIELIRESDLSLEQGDELLSKATVPSDKIKAISEAAHAERRMFQKKYFPTSMDGDNAAASNILKIAVEEYHRIVPSSVWRDVHKEEKLARLVRRLYRGNGGRRRFLNYLLPSTDGQLAILTHYIADAGANVSVAMALPRDCFRRSPKRIFTTIVGKKLRAAGKPIFADLASNGVTVMAMRRLAAANSLGPNPDTPQDEIPLFLFIHGDMRIPFSPEYYRTWFKSFIDSIPELKGLPITPNMIRPSVLLLSTLEDGGAVEASIAKGNHSEDSNRLYTLRLPTKLIYDGLMRDFQVFFETLGLARARGTSVVQGYDDETLQTRIKKLEPTGLGTFCKDPFKKPGFEGKKCNQPDCAGSLCPQMEVILTPLQVARMQIWKRVLEAVAPVWEVTRESRWIKVWLPWLCLLKVVEDKASRGALLRDWQAGTAYRRIIEAKPNFKEPCPW